MGIFNYIDTFFFISLGITFVLILLLVFHFKQQIVSLDHKNDTMFEIINNIVKEITYLKSAVFSQPYYQVNDHDEIINLSANTLHSKQIVENKIIVSDDDGTDNDDSDDDDSDDDDSDDDDSDDDSVNPNVIQEITHSSNGVKVINIELGDNIEVSETAIDTFEDNDNYIDNDIDNDNDNHPTELINNDTLETENIIVEKLDVREINELVLENNEIIEQQHANNETKEYNEQEKQNENIKEVYRKMTLMQLKALVITKGLTSDSSKMRKPELLKLLESNIDENN